MVFCGIFFVIIRYFWCFFNGFVVCVFFNDNFKDGKLISSISAFGSNSWMCRITCNEDRKRRPEKETLLVSRELLLLRIYKHHGQWMEIGWHIAKDKYTESCKKQIRHFTSNTHAKDQPVLKQKKSWYPTNETKQVHPDHCRLTRENLHFRSLGRGSHGVMTSRLAFFLLGGFEEAPGFFVCPYFFVFIQFVSIN